MSSGNGPDKTTGQFHSLKGTVVEAVGNATGSEAWTTSGQQEHAAGEAEVNAAKAKGYVEGAVDGAQGYKDSVVGAVTGDKQQQAEGNLQKEKGEAKRAVNK